MRMYPREFPPKRRRKPQRRAEMRIFTALASSPIGGFAYYEWRRDFDYGELDFAIWVEGLGRVALQVKGGIYRLQDGEWELHTRDGPLHVASSPIDEAWLGALDLHDDIADRLAPAYDPFVVPILAFPDMDPDEAITKLARRKRVNLLWRPDPTTEAIAEILRSQPVRKPLSMQRISREVETITDGLIVLDQGQLGADVSTASNFSTTSESCPEATPASVSKLLRLNVAGVTVLEARAREVRIQYITKR